MWILLLFYCALKSFLKRFLRTSHFSSLLITDKKWKRRIKFICKNKQNLIISYIINFLNLKSIFPRYSENNHTSQFLFFPFHLTSSPFSTNNRIPRLFLFPLRISASNLRSPPFSSHPFRVSSLSSSILDGGTNEGNFTLTHLLPAEGGGGKAAPDVSRAAS